MSSDALDVYTEYPVCKKCGSNGRYPHLLHASKYLDGRDLIQRRCHSCYYSWLERPLHPDDATVKGGVWWNK